MPRREPLRAAARPLMAPPLAPAVPVQSRELLSVVVQALGAAATLATSVLITRLFGVEDQGHFTWLKSGLDMLTTALLFGLPQTLLHLSYQEAGLAEALRRYALRYSLWCLAAACALAALLAFTPWAWAVWPLLAAPLLVYHGLVRSLMLRQRGALVYAWVTAAPALALLAVVLLLTPWAALPSQPWGGALLASAGAAAALAWSCWPRSGAPTVAALPASLKPAMRHTSLHAFAQNMAAAAQVALLLTLLHVMGADSLELGEFAVALLFLQVLASVAAFIAPAVYDRAAQGRGLGLPRGQNVWLGALCVLLLMAALWAAPALLALMLPAPGLPSGNLVLATRLMLLAGALLLGNRIAATMLQARGQFEELSAQALLRLLLSLTATAALALHWPFAVAASMAWVLTESVLAARCAWLLIPRASTV